MQNFYQLLSVDPGATPEEIKKAFRAEIARYHPDKVQHLGKEFQEMAAGRAAALTEAYRTLMNAELRAEYDRLHVGAATAVTAGAPAQTVSSAAQPARPVHREAAPPPPAAERTPGPRFASERRDRDDFVRKATLDRFRAALSAEVGQVEEVPARGFDLDCTARSKKLFTREESQRYAVKVVPQVDKVAVQEAWSAAQKAGTPICVFLMGSKVAPVKELSDAITELRKRSRGQTGISVIPVDVRDWSAHIPADAPAACRNLIKRLREAGN
ncbi:MAG TPA: J domain-containing protein [Vicinamibacterales bacterium]|nr:J domain-containing protein [Vicinamibacterales bacterium]